MVDKTFRVRFLVQETAGIADSGKTFQLEYNLPPYIHSVLGDDASGRAANRPVLYAWMLILGTIALLMTVTALGSRRWRAAGLDLDGKKPPDDEQSQDSDDSRSLT